MIAVSVVVLARQRSPVQLQRGSLVQLRQGSLARLRRKSLVKDAIVLVIDADVASGAVGADIVEVSDRTR